MYQKLSEFVDVCQWYGCWGYGKRLSYPTIA